MGNIFDDGLEEYEQQDNNPTAPVPPSAPQQKSAELAEIEKSLEVIKGIKGVQDEMRSTMSDLTDMAEHAQNISHQLTENIKIAKPVWDDLLKNFVKEIQISDESFEAFNKIMKEYANTHINNILLFINKDVAESIGNKIADVANKHVDAIDERMLEVEKAHEQNLYKLEEKYQDNISKLENSQGKLLAQAVEERNRIIMPSGAFWTIICIFGFIIICGIMGWVKFWQEPGNDETMTWMVGAFVFEGIYYATMIYNHLAYKDEQKTKTDKKKDENKPRIYSISLSEAMYIIFLTLSASVYFVWAQLNINYSPKLLIYLLPAAWAANFLWLMIRGLLYGIFRKE